MDSRNQPNPFLGLKLITSGGHRSLYGLTTIYVIPLTINFGPLRRTFPTSSASPHYKTPQTSLVNHISMVGLSRSVRYWASRCRSYPSSNWILTVFPFGKLQLGFTLGPANPQLTIQQLETGKACFVPLLLRNPCPLGGLYISTSFVATIGKILIPARSTQPHGHASALAEHLSTLPFGIQGLGNLFSPVHFQGL